MRKTERLFALAEYLRGRRTGVTAEELAERFEVTMRTIYRDLDALRAAALPLMAERGRGGGYALERSYSLPPVNFTAAEAAMLVLAGRWIEELRLLPFVETLRSAIDKVHGALPAKSQRELKARMATLSFVGVPTMAPSDAVRRVVERAWYEDRPLAITYEGPRERSDRRVRIRSVVLDRAETLFNCDDLDKGETRQLRLHRITRAVLVEVPV
jgi:predicted DNA-binding transcriptional regulator YafY